MKMIPILIAALVSSTAFADTAVRLYASFTVEKCVSAATKIECAFPFSSSDNFEITLKPVPNSTALRGTYTFDTHQDGYHFMASVTVTKAPYSGRDAYRIVPLITSVKDADSRTQRQSTFEMIYADDMSKLNDVNIVEDPIIEGHSTMTPELLIGAATE